MPDGVDEKFERWLAVPEFKDALHRFDNDFQKLKLAYVRWHPGPDGPSAEVCIQTGGNYVQVAIDRRQALNMIEELTGYLRALG